MHVKVKEKELTKLGITFRKFTVWSSSVESVTGCSSIGGSKSVGYVDSKPAIFHWRVTAITIDVRVELNTFVWDNLRIFQRSALNEENDRSSGVVLVSNL